MTPIEELTSYCQQNGRVWPQPRLWQALYELLPERRQVGAGYIPAAPLILGGWWYSTDQDKSMRLKEHIQWAADHGALERVTHYLHGLQESEWHHLGE
jgi:hypothetical protein